jgi:hypothetical protein
MNCVHNRAAEDELTTLMAAQIKLEQCPWHDCEDVAQGIIEHIRADFPDSTPYIMDDYYIAFAHKNVRFLLTYDAHGRLTAESAYTAIVPRWVDGYKMPQERHYYNRLELSDPDCLRTLSEFIKELVVDAVRV